MLHYALGNPLVRALTLASRPFFDQPPEGFTDVPLGRTMPVLVHAREDELAELDALDAEIAPFATLERVGEREMLDLCPVLRVAWVGSDLVHRGSEQAARFGREIELVTDRLGERPADKVGPVGRIEGDDRPPLWLEPEQRDSGHCRDRISPRPGGID